jgi:hypothetical protein
VSDDANAGQRDSYDTDALVLAARGDEICGQPFLASRIIVREKRGEQFRFTMLLGAADDDLFASRITSYMYTRQKTVALSAAANAIHQTAVAPTVGKSIHIRSIGRVRSLKPNPMANMDSGTTSDSQELNTPHE